jgi:uncharacterized protein involved in exopolysaccharide biosynthesis
MLEAPLRRRWLVVVPVLALAIAAGALARLLPPRYRAAALIRADWDASVAAEMERRGLALAERRQQAVRQHVTERELLERVLREASPYGAVGLPGASIEAQVERLLADLQVRPMSPTSFVIEFTHSDPAAAARVPNLLTGALAPDPDAAGSPSGSSRAELEKQLAEARVLLQEKADALARLGPAPHRSSDASGAGRGGVQARALADSLAAARAREKLLLEAAASEPRASAPSASEAQLERLRGELRALRLRYTEEHPDVEKLRLQIQRLESASSESPTLAQLRATRAEIAELEKRRAELARRGAGPAAADAAARATASAEHDAAQRAYQARLEELHALVAGPGSRGPDLRFEQLREAAVPEQPEFPSPLLFVLGGALAGLSVGLLAALVAEHRDRSVKGPEDLHDILPAPLLATVPLVRKARGERSDRQ